MRNILIFALSVLFVACDDSSNGSSQYLQVAGVTESLTSGGTPNDPTEIILDEEYKISSNSFNNYFKYLGVAGEKLVIHAELRTPLSDRQWARCNSAPGLSETPSSYDTQIHVFDASLNRIAGVCSDNLYFQVPASGTYFIQPAYGSTNSGSLFVSSVMNNSPISSPSGQYGQASNPMPLSFNTSNTLSLNTHFNYFVFTASAGQKLMINTVLVTPLSDTLKARCGALSGFGAENPSLGRNQVVLFDSSLNRIGGTCREQSEFIIPSSGSYILHFNFEHQGYFDAALVK